MAASIDIGSSSLASAAFKAVALDGGSSTLTLVSGGAALQLGKFNLNARGGKNLNLNGLNLSN